MFKRLLLILGGIIAYIYLSAQPAQLILSQQEGRITFAVDEVDLPDKHCGWKTTGSKLAIDLNRNNDGDLFSDWEAKILASHAGTYARVDFWPREYYAIPSRCGGQFHGEDEG